MLKKIVINDKEAALSLTLWRAVEIDACWSLDRRKGVCVWGGGVYNAENGF